MKNREDVRKAIKDVNYIKDIIEKTSMSMTTFSRIFIIWGILFLSAGVFFVVGNFIPVPGVEFKSSLIPTLLSMLSLLIVPLMIFITYVAYKNIVKSNPLKGVSKQLIQFWVYIVIFIFICFLVLVFSNLNGSNTTNFLSSFPISPIVPIELFVLGLGLLCTNIFTKLRFPFILGIIYLVGGLYLLASSSVFPILGVILIPITFLIIGIYFKYSNKTVI